MAHYWETRRRLALAQMERAQSADLRAAYHDLAEHYLAMWRFTR
jgi:hypothetical protein